MSEHAIEVARGERFEFGENWKRFLEVLDDRRISEAQESLKMMLEVDDLKGASFLDMGSGSGLFSLAARRLGARVHSFDFDPQSVACTTELRRRYYPGSDSWTVEEGSVLDGSFLNSLGKFDVVYSWGVLHHTGDLWRALENAWQPVAPNGKLFIALYNDTGSQTARWKLIKRTYNEVPGVLKNPFVVLVMVPRVAKDATRALLTLRFGEFIKSWRDRGYGRGMNRWRDLVDWVGGYPYEVSTPDDVFDFYRNRGFTLTKLRCGKVGMGCNEFVFVKNGVDPESEE